MKALRLRKYGKKDVLSVENITCPEPSKNQVLVQVQAASVNPRDWLLQEGRYQFKAFIGKPPITLGSDFSGHVVAVGKRVRNTKIGDEVFGLSWKMGAFAEYVVVDEASIALKPRNVAHDVAAAIPCAGQTALRALAGLTPGDRIVINGAAGGVGSFAVQFAKAIGCHVVAVASGKNEAFCRDIGADEFIDYETTDFCSTLKRQDMVLDAVGRSSFTKCKSALARDGVYVTPIPTFPHLRQAIMTTFLSGFGVFKKRRVRLVFAKTRSDQLARIAKWHSDGLAKSTIGSVYQFSDIPNALAASKTWKTRGKIVVDVANSAVAVQAI
ncbi:NAD(P)-dependent alcohol dehydrogenase [Thalassovita sp.]|jgi:NADPH:quinone reductase-like Zn-dependent oxidoreductase|uniref:NAD(P)-dependent alcohol dehydrogenase n=1 Tax=Thalassovita sp. TaxID=1979401 RepID=UPI002AB0CBDA|nr:NAD(P)-dependent alcohol dehydrogenase [Thalassovita sp.]